MELPNYFLADLPPEASLSGTMIQEAAQTLKRNRARFLQDRTTAQLVRTLARVAERWLEPDYPIRHLALNEGPSKTGFSQATLAAGLDAFFGQLTEENLNSLLVQELGHAQRLDSLVATKEERINERSAMVTGPELIVHIAAGHIPNPTLMSIVLGLLVRSAQFVKCATGSAFIPRLFAHSIYEVEPKLGACLEIAEWRGGEVTLEKALYAESAGVTATGSDETLTKIKHHLPAHIRFLGYGHRVSFGFVSKETLHGHAVRDAAVRAAADVAAWNQLGCLSPHVIYVEKDGAHSAIHFAELLAEELEKREQAEPRGPLSTESAAAITTRRAVYEIRAAHSPDTKHWCSANSTAWTVIYEADPRFQVSCLNRFIYVKETTGLEEVLRAAEVVRGQVSTVGLAAPESTAAKYVAQLAHWGVTRVCPLGKMQHPPLTWRHDGRPSLGDLVTWTDWEQ